MEVFDPHFHLWSLQGGAQSGHDPKILAPPTYLVTDYERDLDSITEHGFKHAGGVYLEAMSVCFVDTKGEDMKDKYLEEQKFAASQLREASQRQYVIVPSASLEASNARQVLEALAEDRGTVGIRQILNHTPNWPRNGHLGNLLKNEAWQQGFALLREVDFSFDCQMNPHQFASAAAFFAQHPSTPIIVNHLGCPLLPTLQEGEEGEEGEFWTGMKALAALPNTYMKLSMVCRADKDWANNKCITDSIHRIIVLFGAKRCMFASNFPVDCEPEGSAANLYAKFKTIAARYSLEEQKYLFSHTARAAYKCNAARSSI